ncbi:hypothetical protein [Anabaena azotica]
MFSTYTTCKIVFWKHEEEIAINPDEVWGNIRDYVPGREVIL